MKEVGIDLEKIGRFKLKRHSSFIFNTFTKNEIEYSYSKSRPEMHLCGFFCAKEALLKTLGNETFLLKDIEVGHQKNGMPVIRLLKRKSYKFKLSISHAGDYASAVVIRLR